MATLVSRIPQAQQAIHRAGVDAINKAARSAVELAQARAPYDADNTEPGHVHIRDGLVVGQEATVTEPVAIMEAQAPHSLYVELGTADQPAQPYMRPAAATAAIEQYQNVRVTDSDLH